MKTVIVLLSTYNGTKYLSEQLDSLYSQNGVDIHIIARDDGSKDNTVEVLKSYQNKFGKMTILAEDNVGCAKSFFSLIHYACQSIELAADYYAFCDQDDVWLPEKLKRATEKLDAEEGDRKLYFCSANFVDSNLNYLATSHLDKVFNYRTCLYRQPALGCTMVFSRALLEDADNASDEAVTLHDAWLFKCANYLNAKIIADDQPMIKYRQHGENVTSPYQNFFLRYLHALRERVVEKKGAYHRAIFVFYRIYGRDISEEKRLFLEGNVSYTNSIKETINLIRIQPFEACTFVDRFLWRLLILTRCY